MPSALMTLVKVEYDKTRTAEDSDSTHPERNHRSEVFWNHVHAGLDPGFPVGGDANPRGVGCQHTILPNFPKTA